MRDFYLRRIFSLKNIWIFNFFFILLFFVIFQNNMLILIIKDYTFLLPEF